MVIKGVDMFKTNVTNRIIYIFFNRTNLGKKGKELKNKLSTGFKDRVNRLPGNRVEKVLIKACTGLDSIKRIKPL